MACNADCDTCFYLTGPYASKKLARVGHFQKEKPVYSFGINVFPFSLMLCGKQKNLPVKAGLSCCYSATVN